MRATTLATLALLFAALPGLSGALELTPAQMTNIVIGTTVVEERQSAPRLAVNGTIRADRTRLHHVTPVVEGLVTRLQVVENATVRKGQVLARLRSITLGQAQADYLAALARYEVARADLERIEGLRREGVVAQSRLLAAESQYKMAHAELDQRRRALVLAGMSERQIAALERDADSIADYPLVSPIDGVVLEVAIENGQMVAAGKSAFRIADLDQVWADVRIPVARIDQVEPGTRVALRVAAYPGRSFGGRLESLAGEVDETSQTVAGRVVVKNPGHLLRPGMYVQAELEGRVSRGLMVPASALFRSGNDNYVFVVTGPRRFEPVKVEAGTPSGGWVAIERGLKAGQVVVSQGVAELKSHWQYQGDE